MRSTLLNLQDLSLLAPEIEQFDKMTAPGRMPGRLDHPHRAWEYAWALRMLKQYGVKTLLDVGGAGSYFPALAAEMGIEVTVLDVHPDLVMNEQQANRLQKPIHVIKGRAPYDFGDQKFDAVVAISVIEHDDQPIKLLSYMLSHATKCVYLTTDFHPSGEKRVDGHLRTYNAPSLKALADHALAFGWRSPNRPAYDDFFPHVGGDYTFGSIFLTPMQLGPAGHEMSLVSIVRNAETYMPRYITQVLQAANLFRRMHVVVVEGDSTDETMKYLVYLKKKLSGNGHDMTIVKYDTGAPLFGSNDLKERWVHMERIWNEAMYHTTISEFIVCVESDLIWTPANLTTAMSEVSKRSNPTVIFPALKTAGQEDHWHDTNGFELASNGRRFTNHWPFAQGWNGIDRFIRLNTGGGMIVGRGSSFTHAVWANKCRLHFPDTIELYADMHNTIYHPKAGGS